MHQCSARAAQNIKGHHRPAATTNFLTATIYIYAIGAGITAATGTSLALQLFLM